MEQLPNIHPGEVLQEEFLIPLQITAYRLAKDIGIPQTRISEISERKPAYHSGYRFAVELLFWKLSEILARITE